MIDIDNRTSFEIPIELIEKITDNLTESDLELIIDNDNFVLDLNRAYREQNKTTDVLSFPINDELNISMLGTIVISVDYVFDGAVKYRHKPEEEFLLLYIHGLLHLLGYDHETDHGEMRQKESEIIKKYQLPSSLIVRNLY
jgi:probable rRNA maturation factor